MSNITVSSLSKIYKVPYRKPGISASIKHFFDRKYKLITAVDDISFKIDEGEIVGFIGANGAGKTTTLKMLCGLVYPTKGIVSVSGFIPKERNAAFLSQITLVMGQKQQLIWDLPPIETLKVNAAVYGISEKEAKKRIDELASMLELNDELFQPVRKLSLGQRMKSELLASLIHRPSVLFLDEPTLGLDVNAQLRVREFLSMYNKRFNATILLTSHYMQDISSLCKRVVVIHKGRIFYDGALTKLTNKLSPYRNVRIEFDKPQTLDDLKEYCEITQIDYAIATIVVPSSKLSFVVSYLLNNYTIKDLQVIETPLENIISELIRNGTN